MKLLLTSTILYISMVLGSCNKDFTCTCTSDADGSLIGQPSKYNLTREHAESACSNADAIEGQTCVLKEI